MPEVPQNLTENENADSPEALFAAIREQRKTDPLAGAKFGGQEIYLRLLEGMKDDQGVHLESMLCALGALAGYACQAALRASTVAAGKEPDSAFSIAKAANGHKFYFGEAMNAALLEDQYSVWSLAAGGAEHAGAHEFCDLEELLAHTARSIGNADFGVPRLPESHRPSMVPVEYLKVLWPALTPVLDMFCEIPEEWPIVYGVAIQKTLEASKEVLEPEIALKIIMESAIPMARIDLPNA